MGRFKDAIEEDEAKLVEELELDGLWVHLETHKILTVEQLARCRAEVSHINTLEIARAFYVFITVSLRV